MEISVNLVLGVLAVVYGIYSYVQRKTAPENIDRLQAMVDAVIAAPVTSLTVQPC